MKLYRYVDGFIAEPMFFGYVTIAKIQLNEYTVRKETDCGYWIRDGYMDRWVSKTGRKRHSYPTKKEALNSYEIRKLRQREHGERTIGRADLYLESIKKLREVENEKETNGA